MSQGAEHLINFSGGSLKGGPPLVVLLITDSRAEVLSLLTFWGVEAGMHHCWETTWLLVTFYYQ